LIKAAITNQLLGDISTIEDKAAIEEIMRATEGIRK